MKFFKFEQSFILLRMWKVFKFHNSQQRWMNGKVWNFCASFGFKLHVWYTFSFSGGPNAIKEFLEVPEEFCKFIFPLRRLLTLKLIEIWVRKHSWRTFKHLVEGFSWKNVNSVERQKKDEALPKIWRKKKFVIHILRWKQQHSFCSSSSLHVIMLSACWVKKKVKWKTFLLVYFCMHFISYNIPSQSSDSSSTFNSLNSLQVLTKIFSIIVIIIVPHFHAHAQRLQVLIIHSVLLSFFQVFNLHSISWV